MNVVVSKSGVDQHEYASSRFYFPLKLLSIKAVAAVTASLCFLTTPALAEPKPILEELLSVNQTLGGRQVQYPEGKPEMRLFRVTLPVGSKIPLHVHPSPVIVYVQQGSLTNVRLVDGKEVGDVITAGKGFLEGSPDEPHYVVNQGAEPVVLLVTFASVEGLPNLMRIQP